MRISFIMPGGYSLALFYSTTRPPAERISSALPFTDKQPPDSFFQMTVDNYLTRPI